MLNLVDQIVSAGKASKVPYLAPRYIYEVSPGRLKHLAEMHQKQTNKAIARYRSVMEGKGWMSTGEIEQALGVGETIANAFLRKLVKKGYLFKRPKGGTEKYIRNRGWEYRWVMSM